MIKTWPRTGDYATSMCATHRPPKAFSPSRTRAPNARKLAIRCKPGLTSRYHGGASQRAFVGSTAAAVDAMASGRRCCAGVGLKFPASWIYRFVRMDNHHRFCDGMANGVLSGTVMGPPAEYRSELAMVAESFQVLLPPRGGRVLEFPEQRFRVPPPAVALAAATGESCWHPSSKDRVDARRFWRNPGFPIGQVYLVERARFKRRTAPQHDQFSLERRTWLAQRA